jgi:hypothetical protein
MISDWPMSLPHHIRTLARILLSTAMLTSACARPTQPSDDSRTALGALRVTAITSGFPMDEDGYLVLLGLTREAPKWTQAVPANGAVMITGAAPGAWRLYLDGMSPNCSATLPYPVEVTVNRNETTDATVRVQCGPQGLHRTEIISGSEREK